MKFSASIGKGRLSLNALVRREQMRNTNAKYGIKKLKMASFFRVAQSIFRYLEPPERLRVRRTDRHYHSICRASLLMWSMVANNKIYLQLHNNCAIFIQIIITTID